MTIIKSPNRCPEVIPNSLFFLGPKEVLACEAQRLDLNSSELV